MNQLFCLLLLFSQCYLGSVEFALLTQPKTGTHLLIPILNELTKKNVYWAPEYTKLAAPLIESFEKASQKSDIFLFSLRQTPWTREIMDLVWEINQKNNTYLHLHAPYSPAIENYLAEKNCIVFFITRDPRDQIVSLLNHYKNINWNDKKVELIPTDEERLLYMIRQESRLQTIHYMNWLNSPISCVLNFEKLMGTHGGQATEADMLEEMRKIAMALQLDLSDSELKKVHQRHFGHGWNFFKGKVGSWKDYFGEIHKAAIKEEIGDLLIKYEYEKDLEW